MIITAPVTDYIPASILTTHGDLVERGVADPERLAAAAVDLYFKAQGAGATPIYEALALRDTGIHVDNDTRNTGGNQVITGVGFQSSLIIFLAVGSPSTDRNWVVGFDNITFHACLQHHTDGTRVTITTSKSIIIYKAGANQLQGQVTVIGADGFTINWSLTGAITCNFIYLCLP